MTTRRAEDQKRAFAAQIELARATGKPLVIHTRAADDDTLAMLDAHAGGVRVILHCFSMAARIDECLAHPDWWLSFAGNATYPKRRRPARGGRCAFPPAACWSRPTPRTCRRSRCRGKPNAAGQRRADRPGDRGRSAGSSTPSSSAPIDDAAAAVFGW